MIDKSSTLEDVAFAICTKLEACDLRVVLVGGSAATYYAPTAYQSFDADFVAQFAATRYTEGRLVSAMSELGYELDAENTFRNRNGNPFAVEFPKGPLGIGGDYVEYETVNRTDEILNVISETDSVRDRLCCYYYWDDRTALRAAVDVSLASGKTDLESVKVWSEREGQLVKFGDFLRLRESKANQRA